LLTTRQRSTTASVLANGKRFPVLNNYDKPMDRHKAACGISAPRLLGPGSDTIEEHWYFDVVRYRNGTYRR
jgi:hypothetical protein